MLLDGKLVSGKIKEELTIKCEELKKKYGRVPSLAVVLVGDNKASELYVSNKVKACNKVGIKSVVVKLDKDVTTSDVVKHVKELASDEMIDGIMVQLPLPSQIDKDVVLKEIPGSKDVDGLTHENVAKLILNEKGFVPCTPKGVVDLLEYYNIPIQGKNVVIIGRSMLVGKPLSLLLTNKNATVTLCHSKTLNLKKITRSADIIVVAIGNALFLRKEMVKKGTVVVDVGINKLDSKTVGDVDFKNVSKKASYITPVPGGCGPMTVCELLSNTVDAFINKMND